MEISIIMPTWQVYLAHFFGAVFLANAVPHMMAGFTGERRQTPFASPPFRGLSPAWVNVAWGLTNLALAYLLLLRIGPLDLHNWSDAGVSFLGFAAMAFMCARSFTKLRAQNIH